MVDYIHTIFGRFPATVPPIFALMYLQAHQLDTEFYDPHFGRLPAHPRPITTGTGAEARSAAAATVGMARRLSMAEGRR
jgi:hypothetical protein